MQVKSDSSWFKRLQRWLQLKRLEYERDNSEKFQRHCERIRCPTLAELEGAHRARVEEKIRQFQEPEKRG